MRLISNLSIVPIGLVLLVCVAERPASAETKPVKLAYDSDTSTGCVTSFTVEPDEVQINSLWQKVSPRKVVWTPVPNSISGQLSGVTWSFVEKSSNGATCTGLISPVGNGYKCVTHLDWTRFNGNWKYKVVATKVGCQDVTVDPAIIFRGGGGTELLVFLLLALGGGGVVIYWRRHHSRRGEA